MSGKRYAEELNNEAVRQVTEGGYPVAQVAQRLGVSAYSVGIQSVSVDQAIRRARG